MSRSCGNSLVNGFADLARWFGCGELEAAMSFSRRLTHRPVG